MMKAQLGNFRLNAVALDSSWKRVKAATHQANQLETSWKPWLPTRCELVFNQLPTSSQLVRNFFGLPASWQPDRSITTCRLATCCTSGMQKTTRLQQVANQFPTSWKLVSTNQFALWVAALNENQPTMSVDNFHDTKHLCDQANTSLNT